MKMSQSTQASLLVANAKCNRVKKYFGNLRYVTEASFLTYSSNDSMCQK